MRLKSPSFLPVDNIHRFSWKSTGGRSKPTSQKLYTSFDQIVDPPRKSNSHSPILPEGLGKLQPLGQ